MASDPARPRPLERMDVLVTRARHQSEDLVARLEALGAVPHVHPVIAMAPPQDPEPLRERVQRLTSGGYDWVVFTSANAVTAVQQAAGGALDLGACRVACVGSATARHLEEQGIDVDLVPNGFVAEALAEALCEREGEKVKGLRLLFPRAREGREVLPRILTERGALVEVVEAYRTVPSLEEGAAIRELLRQERLHLLTFTAGSTVKAFDALLDDETRCLSRRVPAACIGPVTAAAAREAGLAVRVVPDEHTVDGLIGSIVRLPWNDGAWTAP